MEKVEARQDKVVTFAKNCDLYHSHDGGGVVEVTSVYSKGI